MHVRKMVIDKREEFFVLVTQKPENEVPSEFNTLRRSVGGLDLVGYSPQAGVSWVDFEDIDKGEQGR